MLDESFDAEWPPVKFVSGFRIGPDESSDGEWPPVNAGSGPFRESHLSTICPMAIFVTDPMNRPMANGHLLTRVRVRFERATC